MEHLLAGGAVVGLALLYLWRRLPSAKPCPTQTPQQVVESKAAPEECFCGTWGSGGHIHISAFDDGPAIEQTLGKVR